jgi:alpha-L-rhamnosidase
VDVQMKSTDFKLGNVKDLRFKNVKVNGKKMPSPVVSNASK